MGNSEVGHLNIGAGRVVYMDITKIDLMIENGEFEQNPALLECHDEGAHRRAATAPIRSVVGWRRALASEPSIRACCAWPSRTAWNGSLSIASWTAATRFPPMAQVHRAAAAEDAGVRRRQDRQRQRPLLRHGPRQEVGAREDGIRRHGVWRRPKVDAISTRCRA